MRTRACTPWHRQSGLLALTLLFVLQTAGCGTGSDSNQAPPQPAIEALDEPAPPLPETPQFTRTTTPRLVARLDLRGDESLYVGEWLAERRSTVTALYFTFAGADDDPDPDPIYLFSDALSRPIELHELGEHLGWPDVTLGTVDASVDEVRVTFDGQCGTETYRADGPLLRTSSMRRVFMLDQSDSCLWKTAEAIRDGTVVGTYEKPAAPRD